VRRRTHDRDVAPALRVARPACAARPEHGDGDGRRSGRADSRGGGGGAVGRGAAVTLQIVMRTASRRGGPDYLTRTMRNLGRQRVPAELVHLFPTAPDTRVTMEARRGCIVHAPARAY